MNHSLVPKPAEHLNDPDRCESCSRCCNLRGLAGRCVFIQANLVTAGPEVFIFDPVAASPNIMKRQIKTAMAGPCLLSKKDMPDEVIVRGS
jgi:hypothetical protein